MSKPRGDRQVPPGVREISRDSLNDLVTLLASEGLPIEDVAEPERRFFAFFNADGATVGYGGLEDETQHVVAPMALTQQIFIQPLRQIEFAADLMIE